MDDEDYFTDEDETLADERRIGYIHVSGNEVHVAPMVPADSMENSFFRSFVLHIMRHAQWDIQRVRDLFTSDTIDEQVAHLVEKHNIHNELEGSGLIYGVDCDISSAYARLNLYLRCNVKMCLNPPSSPVPFALHE